MEQLKCVIEAMAGSDAVEYDGDGKAEYGEDGQAAGKNGKRDVEDLIS